MFTGTKSPPELAHKFSFMKHAFKLLGFSCRSFYKIGRQLLGKIGIDLLDKKLKMMYQSGEILILRFLE